jgi:hypothetical protein
MTASRRTAPYLSPFPSAWRAPPDRIGSVFIMPTGPGWRAGRASPPHRLLVIGRGGRTGWGARWLPTLPGLEGPAAFETPV